MADAVRTPTVVAAMTFADRLKAARAAAGLSQYTLADASGILRTMIADYEQGRRVPGIDTLAALAKALGCTADSLLGLAPPVPAKPPSKRSKATVEPEAATDRASTVDEACALAKAQGRTYCQHAGREYRLRRDGWEPAG